MYAAGTAADGRGSSGAVTRRLAGASARRPPFRSHAVTRAMTRPTGETRFTCAMADYRRASLMVSEIVGSGACQNVRATTGGTKATQATTIQYGIEVMPI